jgi:hypothetical protein
LLGKSAFPSLKNYLKEFIYALSVLNFMRRTEQTKLSDFSETRKETTTSTPPLVETSPVSVSRPPRPSREMWQKTINTDQEWGVCNLGDTVLLVRLIDGHIHTHGQEAVCKWCGGVLETRDDKVFCAGQCKRYQGEFSRDLNAFLWWEGVKSYTLRKIVADIEHLELEPRDLEPIDYVPDWSVLYEYEDDYYEESESAVISKE